MGQSAKSETYLEELVGEVLILSELVRQRDALALQLVALLGDLLDGRRRLVQSLLHHLLRVVVRLQLARERL